VSYTSAPFSATIATLRLLLASRRISDLESGRRARRGVAMPGSVKRERGEGQAIWMLGGLYDIRISGDETDGALTLMELTIPPGMAPPPHVHSAAETVYVVEGAVRYHIGDDTFDAGPGAVFHIPARSTSSRPATRPCASCSFSRPAAKTSSLPKPVSRRRRSRSRLHPRPLPTWSGSSRSERGTASRSAHHPDDRHRVVGPRAHRAEACRRNLGEAFECLLGAAAMVYPTPSSLPSNAGRVADAARRKVV
jgi:quercetin dioxygenase-like cupin family protein